MLSSKEQVFQKLKEVIDPELGLNIVDLGLIYDITLLPREQSTETDDEQSMVVDDTKEKIQEKATITMTLTSPFCPVGPMIMDEVKKKAKEIVVAVEVNLVWEPAWSQDKLSDEVKLQLGLL